MLQQTLAIVSNTIVLASVGRLAGVNVLAGISAFFPMLGLLVAFFGGIGAGASILVAQASGRGDARAAKLAVGNALTLAFIFGASIGLAGIAGIPPLLRALGVEEQVLSAGTGFVDVALLGAPVLLAYTIYVSAIAGAGDAWTPLFGAAIQLALTAVLVPLGILGAGPLPPLGAAGAAAGLVLASFFAWQAVMIRLTRARRMLGLDAELLAGLVPQRATVVALLKLGIPSGLGTTMLSLSEIVVLGLVSRQGTRALAAYGPVGQVISYFGVPSASVASAATVFGGQAVGAGRYRRLAGIASVALAVGTAISVPLAIVIDAEAAGLMRLFLRDPLTVALGARLIGIVAWSLPLTVLTQALAAIMRATGDVKWPTVISIAAVWAVQLPVAIAGARVHGIDGVWAGYPAGYTVALLATAAYYRFVWYPRTIPAQRIS